MGPYLAIVAVAGPTWRPATSPFAEDPLPVMLLLKADESMEQEDLAPSRMERARLKVTDFATAWRSRPLGLIAYAGSAHLVLPPTRDVDVVASMAAEISPSIMPRQGDDLASALGEAERVLGENPGSIIVVADTVTGANNAGLQRFRSASQRPIHFLAVAGEKTPELAAIRRAAEIVGASVVPMTADGADIDRLASRTTNDKVAIATSDPGQRWEEAGWWLVPVLAVLVAAAFRREESSGLAGSA